MQTKTACNMASRTKTRRDDPLDYRAFFFQASERLYKTVRDNYEMLNTEKANIKNVIHAKGQNEDLDDQTFLYLQKVRRHAGHKDRLTLSGIIFQWQANHSLPPEEEEACVRILNVMHRNHCDYVNFVDVLKKERLEQRKIESASTQQAAQQKKCLVWCSPIAFDTHRMSEEWLFAEFDPRVSDECKDLDQSVMLQLKDWSWSQEIETFFP